MISDKRKEELFDIASALQHRSCRKLLYRILTEAGLHVKTYVRGNAEDSMRRAILRDFAVWLESELQEAEPNFKSLMLKESEND